MSLLALALCSVRTAQLLAGIAVLVLVLAAGRVRVAHAVLAVGVVALLVVGSVRVLDVEDWHDHGVGGLVRRSLLLFADPFGGESSTIDAHLDLTRNAFTSLDDRPLGGGTAVGAPLRGTDDPATAGAENDIGNAALAFGFLGVAFVIGILVAGLQRGWFLAHRHPTVATLGALGILVLSLRFWWAGSHYATAMLVWLTLGHVDRPEPP